MTPGNTANVILPSWRQGRLLFFTSVTDNYTTRLDYRVAAATMAGETKVSRTFKAPITAEQLAACQQTAEDGPALQQFFGAMGGGNLDKLTSTDAEQLPPCATGANPLIYICSYFNFLRKYSVDQTLVQLYEAREPGARFEAENTLSIYKILSAHLQPERAVALINADIPDIENVVGATTAVANLLREVAIIRHDTGDHGAAIAAMQRAVKLHETEDKWRRLADFAIADKQPHQAIDYFVKAETLSPLAPPPALRMAELLIEAGRSNQAEPFLARAEKAFTKPVQALRAKMAGQAAGK